MVRHAGKKPLTLNLRLPVLLPQNHHADARPLQFTRQRRPVRLNTTPLAGGKISAPKQPLFKHIVGGRFRQRPLQACHRCSLQVVLDRAARHPQQPPDLPRANPVMIKS